MGDAAPSADAVGVTEAIGAMHAGGDEGACGVKTVSPIIGLKSKQHEFECCSLLDAHVLQGCSDFVGAAECNSAGKPDGPQSAETVQAIETVSVTQVIVDDGTKVTNLNVDIAALCMAVNDGG